MAPGDKPGASLRLTLSAAAVAALLSGGASFAGNALLGNSGAHKEDSRVGELAAQVVELREQGAANAVRFETIKAELERIESRLPVPRTR